MIDWKRRIKREIKDIKSIERHNWFRGIAIFLVAAICLGIWIYYQNRDTSRTELEIQLDTITQEIIDSDPDEGLEGISKKIGLDKLGDAISRGNTRTKMQAYFILGHNEFKEGNLNGAEKYYNEALSAISHLNTPLSIEIHGRILTDQIYMTLESGDISGITQYTDALADLYANKGDTDNYIRYINNICNNLLFDCHETTLSINLLLPVLELAYDTDSKELGMSYQVLSQLYWYNGDFIKSINCKMTALETLDSEKYATNILCIGIELGIDYLDIQNYEAAITQFKNILKSPLINESANMYLKVYTYINLYESYYYSGDYGSAKQVLSIVEELLATNDYPGHQEDVVLVKLYKSQLLVAQGKVDQAIDALEKASEAYLKVEPHAYIDFGYGYQMIQGDILYAQGKYSEALLAHEKAIDESFAHDNYHEYNANEALIKDYVALGDYETAYEYSRKNNVILKDTKDLREIQYNQYLLSKFNLESKDNEISGLKQQQAQNQRMLLLSGVFILICITGLALIILQYNKIRKLSEQFKHLSTLDGLTNIPNKRGMVEYLERIWPELNPSGQRIGICMMDVDFFKLYNDNYGHPAGDTVLKSVAKCVADSCRKTDFVARYGGEEFIVILRDADEDVAEIFARRLRYKLGQLNIPHGHSKVSDHITLSVGIGISATPVTHDYDYYIDLADSALYVAKEHRDGHSMKVEEYTENNDDNNDNNSNNNDANNSNKDNNTNNTNDNLGLT